MRFPQFATYLILLSSAVRVASLPEYNALDLLEDHAASVPRSDVLAPDNALEKRKGGGGKGGGGGGGSSGGKSGSSGSSGSSSGSSGSRTGSGSNVGGATRSGSGPSRAYGGGGFYGGGASTPYAAGKRTPKGLIAGALLAPVLLLAVFPGLWLASVFPYHFNNPYRFHNQSAQNATNPNGTNSSLPVLCLCQENSACGCDENDNGKYLDDLVGNGSYPALNKSLVTVADVNGTRTLVLNGTLPNGTTAPGGTDDAATALSLGHYSKYWITGLLLVYAVVFL